MKKILVPFADTHQFSMLVDDYLSGDVSLQPFYRLPPEPGSFKEAILQRGNLSCNRKLLVERLMLQYGSLLDASGSTPVSDNIRALAADSCYTVTTGHQLNIFTGPLYSIYKIATTIKLAITLNEQHQEYRFVPVFWMASEDHDFAEINHISIYGKPVKWDRHSGGAVGRMNLDGIQKVLDEVKEIIGTGTGCLELFENAYLKSATLAEATRKIIHGLFAEFGLVIIDGDDPGLKREFISEMRDDVVKNTSFNAVTASSQKLAEIYKVQVQPRPINLFYLTAGSRERIVQNDDGIFTVLNTNMTFTREKLLAELEEHPGNFSPNVVLRPLYQEKILPNLAYIGGPGELNYWLQFMGAFDAAGISFPVLVLRNCFQLIDAGSSSKLVKLGISIPEIFNSTDYLILKVLENSSDVHVGTDAITSWLQKALHELGAEWSKLDPSLLSSVEAEKQKIFNGLNSLEEKARRALKRKNESVVNQVKNLKDKLLPEGGLQERTENFLPWYCRLKDDFIREIVEQSEPFGKQFVILEDV